MLRFTLFIHLTTSKVSVFWSITAYNTDLQITLDKFANTESTLPFNFQLATYLYEIKNTYLDFAISQQSTVWTNVLDVLAVMAELKMKFALLIGLLLYLLDSQMLTEEEAFMVGEI